MANFNDALQLVLQAEGSQFIDSPADSGGATKYGISLRFLHGLGQTATVATIENMTLETATKLYKQYFWDKGNYIAINNQLVANMVFKFAVNASVSEANKILQRCLRACSNVILQDDGILGDKSLAAINLTNPLLIQTAFKAMVDMYYRSLNSPAFLNGWLNRLYS